MGFKLNRDPLRERTRGRETTPFLCTECISFHLHWNLVRVYPDVTAYHHYQSVFLWTGSYEQSVMSSYESVMSSSWRLHICWATGAEGVLSALRGVMPSSLQTWRSMLCHPVSQAEKHIVTLSTHWVAEPGQPSQWDHNSCSISFTLKT